MFVEEFSVAFSRRVVAEPFAGPVVEFIGDLGEIGGAVDRQIGALGQVLTQQAVDASMSSGQLESCDLVGPGGVIGLHGSVDDVDEVALEDASSTADTLRGLVQVE
jgi:hypothetical protein